MVDDCKDTEGKVSMGIHNGWDSIRETYVSSSQTQSLAEEMLESHGC